MALPTEPQGNENGRWDADGYALGWRTVGRYESHPDAAVVGVAREAIENHPPRLDYLAGSLAALGWLEDEERAAR